MSSNLNSESGSRKPFVCYFCNKEIRGETELGHTAVCSSVLLPCPNKCGVYTPRSGIEEHKRKCPNSTKRRNVVYENPYLNQSSSSIAAFSTVQPPADTPQLQEVKSLQNRIGVLEQYLSNFVNKTKTASGSCQEIERLQIRNRLLEEWKDIVNLRLENVRHELIQQEVSKSEAKEHWHNLRQYLLVFEKFKIEVLDLMETMKNEQKTNKQVHAEIEQKFNNLKNLIEIQATTTKSSLDNSDAKIEKFNHTIENLTGTMNEYKAKFTTLNFDVKALTRIATEATEKLEIQQKQLEVIKKCLSQLKIDQEILEEKTNLPTTTGRMLWKVINVTSRLKKAKESGIVLHSPIFCTHEFGYNVQVQLYLNGLNKWKDRYCLICLHVIKSDYDMTLKWPCNIEGTITLTDLQNIESVRIQNSTIENQEILFQPKNYTKFISAKRSKAGELNEDPQESSSTYIFIPHGTLMKSNYLKDDTIFLDVKINRNSKLTHETEL